MIEGILRLVNMEKIQLSLINEDIPRQVKISIIRLT